MKRRLSSLTFSLLITTPSWGAFKVAIDPGHGGFDRGAVHNKIYESDIALKISRLVRNHLRKDSRFKPLLLRAGDTDLRLPTRVKKSQDYKADLFVSIHVNSNPNPNFKGIEFYIQNQMPSEEENLFLANRENSAHSDPTPLAKKSPLPSGNIESIVYDLKKSHRILESYALGWHMERQWKRKRRSKKSRIRQGPFYVLSQNDIPSVLVEVGYLSNPKERKKLLDPSYQKRLARQIYKGLVAYRNNRSKKPSPALSR